MRIKHNNTIKSGLTNILDIGVPKHLQTGYSTGIEWFDRVMGGEGMFASQVTLFTGTPGAGKTTFAMQLADALSGMGNPVVFNSGEEGTIQMSRVARRLKLQHGFTVGTNTHVEDVISHMKEAIDAGAKKMQPFLIQDSLPALHDDEKGNPAIRVTERLVEFAKSGYKGVYPIIVIIGHVNKNGDFAGKQQVKHSVDTHAHLYIELGKNHELYGQRILEIQKNRFGGCGHAEIVEMGETGLKSVGHIEWSS